MSNSNRTYNVINNQNRKRALGNAQIDTSYGANQPATSPTARSTPVTFGDVIDNAQLLSYEENTPEASTGVPTATTPSSLSSYLDYKNNLPAELKSIYDSQVALIDQSNNKLLKEIEEIRERGLTYAEQSRDNAYEVASINKERDVVDAGLSYSQNQSAYGARSEALASMGLSGSGYSDYLDAQNYSTYRANVQNANAKHTESKRLADNAYDDLSYEVNSNADSLAVEANTSAEAAKIDAKTAYDSAILENKGEIATYKEGMYNKILEGVSDGTYSAEQVEEMSAFYDFSEEQKKVLLNGVTRIKNEQNSSVYNSVVSILNTGNADTIKGAFNDVDALLSDGSIDKPVYDELYTLLNESPQGITYQYQSGKINVEQYVNSMSSRDDTDGAIASYHIQRIGTGHEGDEVDITIGSTKNKGNGVEYDLICGPAVEDDELKKKLNKLATGDENDSPSDEGEGSGWILGINHDNKFSSDDKAGKLVVHRGTLYLYTTKGWVELKGDGDEVNKAIAAYYSTKSYDNIPTKEASSG